MKTSFLLITLLGLSSVASASVGEPGVDWKKKEVRVCWGMVADLDKVSPPRLTRQLIEHSEYDTFADQDKLQVRETIAREYNIARVGIELVGWENCSNDPDADVIIFSEDLTKPPKHLTDLMFAGSYHGCSSIGDDTPDPLLKKFVHLKKFPEYKIKLTSAQALDLIAIHEFGHLVGLRHEHARFADAGEDPNCSTQGMALMEGVGKSAKLYSQYDPNSIMNYCHDYSLMNKTGLDFYTDGLQEVSLFASVRSNRPFTPMEVQDKLFSLNELNFVDSSLVTKTPDVELDATHIQVKIGLSRGDVHALKCMYDLLYNQENCNSNFKP